MRLFSHSIRWHRALSACPTPPVPFTHTRPAVHLEQGGGTSPFPPPPGNRLRRTGWNSAPRSRPGSSWERRLPMANSFVHVELLINDLDTAKTFYASLFDWVLEDVPEMNYTMINVGEGTGGGMMKNPV